MSIAQKEADWFDIDVWCRLPRTVLDIGSGSAGIHKYLAPAFPIKEVHLMDGGKTRRSQMGYNRDGTKAWRNVQDGVSRVKEMGFDVEVFGYEASPRLTIPVDLIISMKSWGFHYPVRTYLQLAKRSLNPGGRIILDLRKRENQIETMAANFHLVELDVGRSDKCFRSVWEHKA